MEIRKTIQRLKATIAAVSGHLGSGGESPAGKSLSQIDLGLLGVAGWDEGVDSDMREG
jgi:hypothetical protein